MRTAEKYEEMGFTELSDKKVQDKHDEIYYPKKASSPLKAIKFLCRECFGMDRRKKAQVENVELVRDCTDPMCPLFDFRLGKNPFIKRVLTEDQRKAVGERLTLAREPLNTFDAQDENPQQGLSAQVR